MLYEKVRRPVDWFITFLFLNSTAIFVVSNEIQVEKN